MDTSSSPQFLNTRQSAAAVAETQDVIRVRDLGVYVSLKRCIDFAASIVLLVALLPVILVIAILVQRDSRGPVIFRQQRLGKNSVTFEIYKFRTMFVEAPIVSTADMQRLGVSYYTKFGSILRRYSLDELPQLWNVLKGDMSLIGPRPALVSQVQLNTQRQILRIDNLRPGITGLAQVYGRDDLSDADKVNYDLNYRTHCSFFLDCRIALRTVVAVFTGFGAN
jgi:lipopolysaccharide/colanic/teichoic acid biosynthesis glycosyltransferase